MPVWAAGANVVEQRRTGIPRVVEHMRPRVCGQLGLHLVEHRGDRVDEFDVAQLAPSATRAIEPLDLLFAQIQRPTQGKAQPLHDAGYRDKPRGFAVVLALNAHLCPLLDMVVMPTHRFKRLRPSIFHRQRVVHGQKDRYAVAHACVCLVQLPGPELPSV